jgi:hypothetical protein
MGKKHEETGRAHVLPLEDDAEGVSGVHVAPWLERLRRLEGVLGADARALLTDARERILGRFYRVPRADWGGILDAAVERLLRGGSRAVCARAQVQHAVFCSAIDVDRRRWEEEIDAPKDEVEAELLRARRSADELHGRERQLFLTVCALDDVAVGDEGGKAVLHGAVAHQMRRNTAHQHLSRAWRKICADGRLGAWGHEWRSVQRFVCDPPSIELWEAARAYMDACDLHGGHGGAAFDAWVKAHEDHNDWFAEYKKQSARAALAWRAFASSLSGSRLRPGDVAATLVAGCAGLGLDARVFPAKVAHQGWIDLLDRVPRPSPPAREAWRLFLRTHGFERPVEEAFHCLEQQSVMAEETGAALNDAFEALLLRSEQLSPEFRRTRDDFLKQVAALSAPGRGRVP